MNRFFSSVLSGEVRYHDLPGELAPIVFIHGLGCAASYEYPRVAADPALRDRRMILVDLPGSGFSDKPTSFSYTTSDQARVIAELLNHLALPAFTLYGHSMGGSIAIEVAALKPANLTTLLVSEPNFRAGGGSYSRMIAAQDEIEFIAYGHELLIEEDNTPWAGSLQMTLAQAAWRGASSLVNGITPSWLEIFTTLPIRCGLIVGEYSLPDTEFDAVTAAGIPLSVVARAGHSMSWENPQGLAAAIAAGCQQ
ncbi:alpha/beta fold hydrolase [Winslowiella iniecta]|uniref:Alpha/beta hydrolase n=2 Tax=Winslowiella iniecta TaxID=1560201 RepID=A0A0L7T5X6_9GAMM|nr:alpha/beta hydrolase [Winslowiella iniecta]KOC90601.1 alpha/beta hydrolase [Winslowiella iniecta]